MVVTQRWNNKMNHSTGSPQTDQLKGILVNLARHRDKRLFLKLYDHFAPRLKHYLIKQGATGEQSEEILQEAMLSVWKNCDRYDPGQSAVSTWIFRIARNQWIDYLRKNKPQLLASIDLYPEQTVDLPEYHADQKQLKAALDSLPANQTQLVFKAYYEGKSHREIANDLDIPLGSVKSGLRLAFRKLRSYMGGES